MGQNAGVLSSQMSARLKYSTVTDPLMCRICWPRTINKNLVDLTGSGNIAIDIRKRRLRWLGYVLRMKADRIPKIALRWILPAI